MTQGKNLEDGVIRSLTGSTPSHPVPQFGIFFNQTETSAFENHEEQQGQKKT